ncbi:serine/threonine-protein kinase [Polyangium aurulentum]|uniref:serine/threonine-protein kinase n=1 Tax=Polyangium aurulentum TaxID=2567896 RepID=UPI00146AF81C|nr:serine/threonine-protein kinase [Polyangium aurulentum]UQA60752.1 serine/threonine-protein kinase PknK [Polyangium aurulentum]
MSLVGQQIDRYRLVEKIGAGGMAEVYRANDEVLGRDVAIKLLHPEIARNTEGRQRFVREAQAMARLEHPGIVRVYEVGITEDERPFLVMELLRGGSLADALERFGKLPPYDVARIVAQAARALQAAHDAGFVHGDIKPGNIAVTNLVFDIELKILDFGIARMLAGQDERPGGLAGTPMYMASEQIGRGEISNKVDIYALGVVAYEALTGRRPFEGRSPSEIFRAIVFENFVNPRTLDSSIPQLLEALILDMLAREPMHRPHSMAEVARRAQEIIDWFEQPVQVPPAYASTSFPASAQADRTGGTGGSLGVPMGVRGDWTGAAIGSAGSAPMPALDALKKLIPKKMGPSPDEPPGEAGLPPGLGEEQEAPRAPAELVQAALPVELRPHHEAITRFLMATFARVEAADARGVLRLSNPHRGKIGDYHFLALFMAGASQEAGDRLGTRTFLNYAIPLEARLASFDREERKVVVAIVDSPELGAGVRRKIFEYRKTYSAHVVPLHLAEVRKADREGRAAELFDDRLSEFHTREDLFASREPARDPTRFYGMKRELAELSAALDRDVAFVAVTGPPGSGKTSLVHMAEYGLEGLGAIHLRASEATERRAAAFAKEIVEHLDPNAGAANAEGPLGERIRRAAEAAQEAARKAGQKALLVVEDADWLLAPLVDPAAGEAQREARELVSALGREARRGALAVVFTGFYGFILEKRTVLGWDNPAATIAKIIRLERLDLAATARMLRELGAEMNVVLDEGALAEIHALSGGNIDLARRLASGALERERAARRGGRPLESITVRRSSVREAARALEALPGTFERTMMALLSAVDRPVLQYIAVKRPRSVRDMKTALAGTLAPDACGEAFDRLHEMGFVEVKDGRVRVTIPLLEAWVEGHLENTPGEARRNRHRRAQILAIGASLTALAFGAYWTWFRAKSVLSAPTTLEGCTYRVRFPERGAAQETLAIYVFRECNAGTDPGPIDLFADMGTVAKIDGQDGGKSDVMRCKPGSDCRMVGVPVTLVSPGEDEYRFRTEVRSKASASPLFVDVRIKDDPLAAMKRTFDGAIKVATALPALLGVLLAFYRDMIEAVRRLWMPPSGADEGR